LSLLEEVHLGSKYTETCILNVLLIVTHKLVTKVHSSRMNLSAVLQESVDKLETKLLVTMDEISQKQICLYQ
jgi:hypothetical protein